MKRIGLSKKVRFAVFARDNFTCRYCGAQPPSVILEVDHIQPVVKGGTNEPENLITGCFDCNRGKAGKTIAHSAPTEADRLRIIQEDSEQRIAQKAAAESALARAELRQTVCNYFCEVFGRDEIDRGTLSVLVHFANLHGADSVFDWIEIANRNMEVDSPDWKIGQYISGIRRKVLLSQSEGGKNAS